MTDQQIDDQARPISPYELDKGRKAGAGLTPSSSSDRGDRGAPISPSELGYKGGLFGGLFKDQDKDEVATFTGEAPRTNLTAPPTGYMTPSPNHPYGLSAKKEAPKPFKLEDRGTEHALISVATHLWRRSVDRFPARGPLFEKHDMKKNQDRARRQRFLPCLPVGSPFWSRPRPRRPR